MPIIDRNYRWFSKRLRDRYNQYTNIFLGLLFLGAALIWLLPMLKSLSETIIKYGSYMGFVSWAGAVVIAIVQYNVKKLDIAHRKQHERIVKDKQEVKPA